MVRSVVALLTLVLVPATVAAAQQSVASVFSIQGSAVVVRGGTPSPLKEGAEVYAGEEVQVGNPGRVALRLADQSYVRLTSGARMRFPTKEPSLNLVEGSLHFFSHSEQHPTVVTEHVTAAIRGTEFTVTTSAAESSLSMLSGSVDASTPGGRVALTGGEGARFRPRRPPEVFAIAKSERSVQWSLYVPFLGWEGALPDDQRIRRALELASRGETLAALKTLPAVGTPCEPALILRARLLIASGATEEGARSLERCAVSSSAAAPHALAEASLALLRLQQGDLLAADNLSRHAVESEPTSAAARIARSFAMQAKGDLDGALAAVEPLPNDTSGELRARRAEVLFMFGYVPEARGELEQIQGRSWYSEAVYGFVLMGDRDFDGARAAFGRAVSQEPSAALPRMGLGIVSFNQGDLSLARTQFEQAAVLEPNRSIYRSYLGKDYFEQDTYAPAHPEYERAIELDPSDPTPHLYRSFMRVAENDLIGALDDINQARELSSRRDVYRSSFLLDEDSAVQAASIGRVYNELGFRERGRVEAVTAIIDDYMNASAHRLLSQTQEDIYLGDTIASERRMANLFAPLSINVVDAIGTSVSLNEYSQLLEEDGWRTGINNFYDSKAETFKTGVLSAHKFGNYAIGLSAEGLGQDGIADDPRTGVGTVGFSFQAQPDYGNRFLFEARGVSSGQSDFTDSADVLEGSLSAAWLHRFSPENALLLNSTYDRSRSNIHTPSNTSNQLSFRDYQITTIFEGIEETELVQLATDARDRYYETSVTNEAQFISDTELIQHIFTYRNVHNVLSESDSSSIEYEYADGATQEIPFSSAAPSSLNGNYASYLGDLKVAKGLHLNFGGEYDSVEFGQDPEYPPYTSETLSQTLWSPKGGIVYNPDESLIFRVGYSEQLAKGTKFDLISLQPTTVGGIVQRFNDDPGTKAQTFGVGLDLHPTSSTYFGGEWTRRWLSMLTQPTLYDVVLDFDNLTISTGESIGSPTEMDFEQNFVTAYLYEVLSESWIAGLDYRYAEQLNYEDTSSYDQRGKAFTRYYWTGGWFVQGSSTYRYQNFEGPVEVAGADGAWLFGAGLGYRLPTRHGILLLDVNNIFGENIDINQSTYFNEPVWSEPTVQLVANFNF